MTPKRLPLIAIPPKSAVYALGTVPRPTTPPLLKFSEKGLYLSSDGDEALAIVGHGQGRRNLVDTLLSKHRFHPRIPIPGMFPSLSNLSNPAIAIPPIRHLTFSRPSATGEFVDYTARYGALQEEDRQTLFDFYSTLDPTPTRSQIEDVAQVLGIQNLLPIPIIGLSSGQTRRSRIGAGLLCGAKVLLLEDPFAGLDIKSRAQIGDLLGDVHRQGMNMVLVLRGMGKVGMPRWITNVARVEDDHVWTGSKEEYLDRVQVEGTTSHVVPKGITGQVEEASNNDSTAQQPVVEIKNVTIAYGTKTVLSDVSWSILPSDRIHLQGSNGSGKTTLLSLLLGHHPRSYAIPRENLRIFSKPRRDTPTPDLRRKIGHTSPEIFAAFPRNMGLTVGEAIGTGFEGVFSRRNVTEAQKERVLRVLEPFINVLQTTTRQTHSTLTASSKSVNAIYETDFSHLAQAQQSIILFLRAIISRPPLLVLDEFSQTIDEQSWVECKALLEREWKEIKRQGGEQAVVVVSHYEEEIPWAQGEGRVFRLKDGQVEFAS